MNRKITWMLSLVIGLALLLAACQPAATQAPAATQPSGGGAATSAPASNVKELKIFWAQWSPADYLQQIGNMYEKETGVKVTVVQEPWGSFGDVFFKEMAAKGTSWDMVVGDSQWLGQGATQGMYLDLTDFLQSNGIADSVTEATMQYYGRYDGKLWGYPTEGDADGWAYRKDLFEDAKNKEDFKAKYGYDLAVPQNYNQLLDIAKFFTRPDQGLYGVAIYTQKDYDAITMGVENTMFAWGANWQDANNNVTGVVNSKEAVEAVEFYKQLYECCQVPGLNNAFYTETNDAVIGGKAVMAMNYFAFFPALANPGTNPFANQMGFFPNPAGPTGQRGAALGGQGMSIINFIPAERQEAAKAFIKWFAQDEIQTKWAELGGYTCNKKVLQSDAFLKATPYNPAFAETMTFVKDFWNIPIYSQLLEVTQRELSKFIVEGQGEAQATMDTIAQEHDKILRENGYIK